MFCPECGTELMEQQRFCHNCGTALSPDIWKMEYDEEPEVESFFPSPAKNTPDVGSGDFRSYLNKYIRDTTTYSSAFSFLSGAAPLRFRWPITCLVCLLLSSFFNIGIGILGFIFSFIITRLICAVLVITRNRKQYPLYKKSLNIDDLASFLDENLCDYQFTAWRSGHPSFLGSVYSDCEIIECLFRDKTFHRIILDQKHAGSYRIVADRLTGRERLKDAGSHNPTLMFISDFLARPILEAAIKYYLRHLTP